MNPHSQDLRFLWHMFEHSTHVLYIVMGMDLETYVDTIQVRLATERGLDIIGRAAAHVTDAFKRAHDEIPWQRIAAVASTLAYPDGIPDDDLVWGFLRQDLPRMMEHLEPLIGPQAAASEA